MELVLSLAIGKAHVMATLLILIYLMAGALLGLRFNVFILVPVSLLVAVVTVVGGIVSGHAIGLVALVTSIGLLWWKTKTINHQTAVFRQINKETSAAHHDALEFPDGQSVLLTFLCDGQAATVLQLPAQPSTAAEAHAQKRVTYVG